MFHRLACSSSLLGAGWQLAFFEECDQLASICPAFVYNMAEACHGAEAPRLLETCSGLGSTNGRVGPVDSQRERIAHLHCAWHMLRCLCTHAEPNAGNGADLERYSWVQTLGDVVVSVPVPPGTKGRACAVDIKKKAISAGLAGAPPLLAGELWAPVQAEECFWNVDGRTLEITLQKARVPRPLGSSQGMIWVGVKLLWRTTSLFALRAAAACR